VADVTRVDADLGVVVAYGRIIPSSVLDVLAVVNLHFSLLPRWRGAAPVERALLAGDDRTGVCVMDVAEALDEGDVYARAEVVIGPDATLDSLRGELVDLGTALLLTGLRDGFGPPVPQQGEPVYAAKITQDDKHLDFTRPAEMVRRVVSLGGAWTTFRGKRFKIHAVRVLDGRTSAPGSIAPASDGVGPRAGTSEGWVELVEVQPEGRPKMAAIDWARGARLESADRLGS
ncbi:MAG TPA: methionyl-tRNA formyltransferase, partial [Acidimicrobiales bacterium]|nr:methionyl-tRNA formyltransferase [Acidimicrobiales bacterium]